MLIPNAEVLGNSFPRVPMFAGLAISNQGRVQAQAASQNPVRVGGKIFKYTK